MIPNIIAVAKQRQELIKEHENTAAENDRKIRDNAKENLDNIYEGIEKWKKEDLVVLHIS